VAAAEALDVATVEVGDARWERGGAGWQAGARAEPLPPGTVGLTLPPAG